MSLQLFIVILSGVLATACPGVLERVQAHRIEHGWGLMEAAPPEAVLLGVEDCRWLGHDGEMDVKGLGRYRVRVVDCQQAAHQLTQPMHARGIVADVSEARFNHKRAVVILR